MSLREVFSFDLGTNSVGWAVLALDSDGNPTGIVDAGVRIFSDGREPKSGTSLAEGRRVARERAGMTQTELADRLGEYQSFVARMESGQRRVDLVEFVELSEVLRFDPLEAIRKLKGV